MRRSGAGPWLGSVFLGIVAATGISLALLAANDRSLVSADALLIFGLMVGLVGVPVALTFRVLSAILGRSFARFDPTGVRLAAGLGLLGMTVLTALFAGRDGRFPSASNHVGLAAYLALVLTTWRSAPPRRLALLVGAATCILVGAGFAPTRPLLRQPATAPPPAVVAVPRHPGRLLLIGIDGLGWETLQRWQQKHASDDYRWLAERFHIGPLETIRPTDSPVIWTTIATGRPPSAHGVWGFTTWAISGLERPLARVPRGLAAFWWLNALSAVGMATEQPISSFDPRSPALWEIAAPPAPAFDVVGWWGTWPALPTAGRVVSDKFFFWRSHTQAEAHGSQPVTYTHTVHPPELAELVAPLMRRPAELTAADLQRFIDIPADEALALARRPYQDDDLLSELPLAFAMDETYYGIAEHLLASGPADGRSAFYFRGVDILSHAALQYSNLYGIERNAGDVARFGDAVTNYYTYTFARLRRLVEAAGVGTAVLVVSDHGFEQTAAGGFGHLDAPSGILMAGTLGQPPSAPAGQLTVYDVAPTALWLTGFPLADDMRGRAARELFPGLSAATEIAAARLRSYGGRSVRARLAPAGTEAADGEMLELLRGLGYIN